MGLVKNRTKSSQFYRVNAYVTRILNERRQIIEYQSVRTRPQGITEHRPGGAASCPIRAGRALPGSAALTPEPGQLTLLLCRLALAGMGPPW